MAKIFYNEILIKMKNLDLNGYGVQEMNAEEMVNVEGGLWPIIIVAALILSSCTVNVTVGDNNTVNGTTSADSTGNGNSAGQGSGNKVK